MKYYIIAGEASGDLHGSNLMKGLNQVDSDANFRFWGGDLMQRQGGELVKHYKETAIMGFVEVLLNLGKIKGFLKECKTDIKSYQPDVLILIDYPGFNLRMAKYAKSIGLKVYYYISPKIWAWKESRIKQIKSFVDKMFVIFPFEVDYFKKHHYPVDYAGNPLLDAVQEKINEEGSFQGFIAKNNISEKPIIAILAGSRKQEIDRNLGVMLEIMPQYKDYQFVIAGAPSLADDFYTPFLKSDKVEYVSNKTYTLLKHSHAALVTSGTATLETALFGIPQVVCYKGNWISYQIAKRIITLDYISLVNLIMKREVVKELIQNDLSTKNLKKELSKIVDGPERGRILSDYKLLKEKLGGKGASQLAAQLIVKNA